MHVRQSAQGSATLSAVCAQHGAIGPTVRHEKILSTATQVRAMRAIALRALLAAAAAQALMADDARTDCSGHAHALIAHRARSGDGR